eukprot:1120814-Alexandrium_andersonii.AAC.1
MERPRVACTETAARLRPGSMRAQQCFGSRQSVRRSGQLRLFRGIPGSAGRVRAQGLPLSHGRGHRPHEPGSA